MKIEKIVIGKLNPAKYNPRKDLKPGDSEYEKLKTSINEFGYVEPIVWNKHTGNVVSGHQRLKVLKSLNYTEVDTVVLEIKEEAREKALNVALNKISGEFDIPLLTDLLKDLNDNNFDVSITGFDAAEIDDLFKSMNPLNTQEDNFDVNKAIEEIDEPISKLGDIWYLGNHRLICGDSTSKIDVDRLMEKEKAHFIFTDPPWNVAYGTNSHPTYKKREILNDNMSKKQFAKFMTSAFDRMRCVCVEGAMVYVVMSAQEWGNIMNVLESLNFHWSSTIIWKKDRLVLSRKDYHTQYEPIWYGWLEGKRINPLSDRKQSDVWEIPRPAISAEHPTMKPVSLVSRAIINSSRKSDVVIDFFGGSGTTLIACEQTDRKCRMMELDPKYCDVIVKRYLEFKGDKLSASLLRDGNKIPYENTLKT